MNIYEIVELQTNEAIHLSIKINYTIGEIRIRKNFPEAEFCLGIRRGDEFKDH